MSPPSVAGAVVSTTPWQCVIGRSGKLRGLETTDSYYIREGDATTSTWRRRPRDAGRKDLSVHQYAAEWPLSTLSSVALMPSPPLCLLCLLSPPPSWVTCTHETPHEMLDDAQNQFKCNLPIRSLRSFTRHLSCVMPVRRWHSMRFAYNSIIPSDWNIIRSCDTIWKQFIHVKQFKLFISPGACTVSLEFVWKLFVIVFYCCSHPLGSELLSDNLSPLTDTDDNDITLTVQWGLR